MKLLIKGGRVVDPANKLDALVDILVEDGKIASIAKGISVDPNSYKIIDATGKVVVPGLIDMHTHLREPGHEYKETIETGSRAAVVGGFTGVACMANTNPVNDSASVTEYILNKAAEANLARIYPVGALTVGLAGERITPMAELKQIGVVAVSDDGHTVANAQVMRRAMEYAATFDLPVLCHCEDKNLSIGVMNEGFYSTILGVKASPPEAEDVIVAREICLSKLTGARVHIQHLTTARGVEMVRQAKEQGLKVTAEATPHHLTLTDKDVENYDTNTKVNPPLRGKKDVEAIKAALRDGVIDAIATDHAPHSLVEKDLEYESASFGIIGLETAVPVLLKLVNEGNISLVRLVESLTIAPARILGLPAGTLSIGNPADITILDLEKKIKIDRNKFRSKSHNSPFHGWELRGCVCKTIVGGKVVFTNEL